MGEFIWIVLCLFASVGITQCILWLAGRRSRPKGMRYGYHIIPMYDDPPRLEAQLRYGLNHLGWCGGGSRVVILTDMGLGEESRAICYRFMQENAGLLRCRADQLPQFIRDLDRQQEAVSTDVKSGDEQEI